MQRDRVRSLAVAILAVLAITLAAAILSGAVQTGPLQDFGLGNAQESESPGEGSPDGGFVPGSGGARGAFGLFCISHPLFVYGIPVFVGLVVAGLVYRFGSWAASRLSAGFVLLVGLPYAVLTACTRGSVNLEPPAALGDTWQQTGSVLPSPSSEPFLVLALLLTALLGLLAMVWVLRERGRSTDSTTRFGVGVPLQSANPTSDLAGVADVAGSAADRIRGTAAIENEVYRAWREMTTHLDVEEPSASTPGEFAEAAVAAGLDAENVGALTEIFEEVRYGDADPAAYEDDAVAALRAIETDAERRDQEES